MKALANGQYRLLIGSQFTGLIGNGLATVAIGLTAYQLVGLNAGLVLGALFALRMATNIFVSPLILPLVEHLPKQRLLVVLDAIRLAAAVLLPFCGDVWQLFALIVVMQSASAVYTPTIQALLPGLFTDPVAYTQALSLSRISYDLDALLSPILAAVLLVVIPAPGLFAGTLAGYAISLVLLFGVTSTAVATRAQKEGYVVRVTRGLRIYLQWPALRGLLGIGLAAAVGGATVSINTVLLVQDLLARPQQDTAMALAAFGAGSIIAAFVLPAILRSWDERPVMLLAGSATVIALLLSGYALLIGPQALRWPALLLSWAIIGASVSFCLTPVGRLITRHVAPAEQHAVFAAQSALSHGIWLLPYLLAGLLGLLIGPALTMLVFAVIAVAGLVFASWQWPVEDDHALSLGAER